MSRLPADESVLNPTLIQSTSDINHSQLSQISFQHWFETMTKGPNNRICPIRAYLHHEQFDLVAGLQLNKMTDIKNNIKKELERKQCCLLITCN